MNIDVSQTRVRASKVQALSVGRGIHLNIKARPEIRNFFKYYWGICGGRILSVLIYEQKFRTDVPPAVILAKLVNILKPQFSFYKSKTMYLKGNDILLCT